jgi:hypothetical protein
LLVISSTLVFKCWNASPKFSNLTSTASSQAETTRNLSFVASNLMFSNCSNFDNAVRRGSDSILLYFITYGFSNLFIKLYFFCLEECFAVTLQLVC